jgi:Chitinase class I
MRNYGLSAKLIVKQIKEAELEPTRNCLFYLFRSMEEYGLTSRTSLITILSTIGVECPSFIPQIEWGTRKYFESIYGDRLGGYYDDVHPKYCGRGLIQLSWDYNYLSTGKRLGIDLINNPDLALELPIACDILCDFFVENKIYKAATAQDWRECRRLVNGNGKDKLQPFTTLINYFDLNLAR